MAKRIKGLSPLAGEPPIKVRKSGIDILLLTLFFIVVILPWLISFFLRPKQPTHYEAK